jgi:molybdopterin-guanine dinucleotide biosynthesis protein A
LSTNVKPQVLPYQFHPLELSIVGYSGAGKTTLIEALILRLKSQWSIAYIKHDAHGFQMDTQGKDTYRAGEAGAEAVFISDASRSGFIGHKTNYLIQRSLFLEQDAALIEGYKALSVPKIVVLSDGRNILDEIKDPTSILAFTGPQTVRPQGLEPSSVPYFARDDIDGLSAFVHERWTERLRLRPLTALILVGGRSVRMGRDKGLIPYRGQPQYERLYEELSGLGLNPVLSLRGDQWTDRDLSRYRLLKDRFHGFGPLGGILTAQHELPETAWLTVACDLPLLDQATIQNLMAHRDPRKHATAYRSNVDSWPEPLCAIYEPKIKMRLHEALGLGLSCPRKVLLNTDTKIIDPIRPDALANANTPDDYNYYAKALEELHP